MLFVLVQGFVPFFVSATAGTTVYGAFDPLVAISDVCKKYNIWMHVDVSQTDTNGNIKTSTDATDSLNMTHVRLFGGGDLY